MEKPTVNVYRLAVEWTSYLLMGALFLNNLLNAYVNAALLVRPWMTYIGSAVLIVLAIVAEMVIVKRKRSLKVKSKDKQWREVRDHKTVFALLGTLLLLWCPRFITPHSMLQDLPPDQVLRANQDLKSEGAALQTKYIELRKRWSDVYLAEGIIQLYISSGSAKEAGEGFSEKARMLKESLDAVTHVIDRWYWRLTAISDVVDRERYNTRRLYKMESGLKESAEEAPKCEGMLKDVEGKATELLRVVREGAFVNGNVWPKSLTAEVVRGDNRLRKWFAICRLNGSSPNIHWAVRSEMTLAVDVVVFDKSSKIDADLFALVFDASDVAYLRPGTYKNEYSGMLLSDRNSKGPISFSITAVVH